MEQGKREQLNIPVIDGGEPQNDPLRQAVKSYKDAMRPSKKDLDLEFLRKTLDALNDSSPLKVARNPIDSEGAWRSGVELRNVRGFEIDEDGRLTMRTRGDNTEFPVEKAIADLDKIARKIGKDSPVMLAVTDEKRVRITDAYSHAFVRDAYAGLPFDLVLAYFEEDEKAN